jgi:UDP-N-acetylmuramyl tripeptide synthase
MDDIIRGMRRAPQRIEDRANAISHAIRQAKPNDVIFLAGKGHETVQEIMGIRHPFVDAEHAARALGSLLKAEEMS